MVGRNDSVMNDLTPADLDDITLQRILNDLLDAKKNLELKTHIYNPKDLAGLFIEAQHYKSEELEECGDLVESYIEIYLKYMVSKDRESRKEIIRAVSSMFDKETIRMSISDKMTKNLK